MDIPTVVVTGIIGVVVGAMLDMFRVSKKFQQVLDEISALRAHVAGEIGGLRDHIDDQIRALRENEIGALRAHVAGEIGGLRDHVDAELRVSRDHLDKRFDEGRAEIRHLDRKIDGVARDVADIRERVAVLEMTAAS